MRCNLLRRKLSQPFVNVFLNFKFFQVLLTYLAGRPPSIASFDSSIRRIPTDDVLISKSLLF
nr:MAG TPA: hypothetical protein [Caudoviricetes sp.]DAX40196.1 MAG TPA: hypothetical protein [Caudoviricetes sp.]